MTKPNLQRRPTDWFRLAFWLLVVGILNVMAGAAAPSVLFFLAWLLNVILGSAGIYCELKTPRRAWPNVLVTFSLLMLTPGGFYNLCPWPLVPIFASPSYLSTHVMSAIGATLTLVIGAVVAWLLAICTTHFAKWADTLTKGWLRWLIPLPLFVLSLVAYNIVIAAVLGFMCWLGLYHDMGGFHGIS